MNTKRFLPFVLPLLAFILAVNSAPSQTPHSGPSSPDDIVTFLNQRLAWYGYLGRERAIAGTTDDLSRL
ncbi:MAG: hypothetical protein WAL32_11050 [Terriglobales bacterium]